MLGNLQAPANPGGWDSAFPSHLKGGVQETARITSKIHAVKPEHPLASPRPGTRHPAESWKTPSPDTSTLCSPQKLHPWSLASPAHPQKTHPQSPASSTHTMQLQYRRQKHLPSGSSSFPTTQPSPWMENPLKPPSGCRAAQLLGHELPFHAGPRAASSSNDFQAYPPLETPSSCSPTRAHPLPNPSLPSPLQPLASIIFWQERAPR